MVYSRDGSTSMLISHMTNVGAVHSENHTQDHIFQNAHFGIIKSCSTHIDSKSAKDFSRKYDFPQ